MLPTSIPAVTRSTSAVIVPYSDARIARYPGLVLFAMTKPVPAAPKSLIKEANGIAPTGDRESP